MVKEWGKKSIENIMRVRKERVIPSGYNNVPCIELEHIEPITGRILNWAEAQNQKSLKAVFYAGDVLFGKLRPYLRKFCLPNFDGLCSTEFWVLTPIDNTVDNNYIYYIVQTDKFLEVANSTTGTKMPRADWMMLKEVEFLLPPLPEQRAIATVLSDADAYIAALEKLIAKKRNLKQGAMQELLTGKRRLPGFSGEWVEKRIDEFGIFKSGNGFPLIYQGGHVGYPFYKVSDFSNEGNEWTMTRANHYVTLEVANILNCNLMPKDSIVFAKIGAAIFLERKRMVSTDCCIDNNMMAFITNESVGNAIYLCYLMQTISFGELVTATALPSLSAKSIGEINRSFPPTKDEQTAIATILSDMDAEIDALTARLNKAKHMKQGMMSELLTGRIRLVEPTASAEATTTTKMVELPRPKQVAKGHSPQFDDAVMIAGIVDVLYSDRYLLGRKKVQKCLYLLRRHQDESTDAFKKKAAGPYADEVRYKGGEPIALGAKYIATTTVKGKGTTFARGKNISQALRYISAWGKEGDIKWVADKLKYKKVDDLELLATVDMAICDLTEAGTPVTVAAIKHLIATNAEWQEKLTRQTFSDANLARAMRELEKLLQGGN